jgi:hypothetical protein
MTRALQVSFVILAAVLCAMLATSCTTPERMVITEPVLRQGLQDTFGVKPILEDGIYQTVEPSEIVKAAFRARVPYRPDVSDCDKIAADTLYHIRRARYHLPSAVGGPAAGRIACHYNGGRHCLVWSIGADGTTTIIDPSTLQPILRSAVQAWRVTDK